MAFTPHPPGVAASLPLILALLVPFSGEAHAKCGYAKWLEKASEDRFVFLKGARQFGYYFAVFAVGKDKIAFCYHDLKPELNRNTTQLSIMNKKGDQVTVFGAPARPVRKTFTKPVSASELRGGWVRWSEVYGRVYPLQPGAPQRVRLVFEWKTMEDADSTLHVVFDEVVCRPSSDASEPSAEAPAAGGHGSNTSPADDVASHDPGDDDDLPSRDAADSPSRDDDDDPLFWTFTT